MIILKQSVGIDVSKNEFYARILRLIDTRPGRHKHGGIRRFDNTPQGFSRFVNWLAAKTTAEAPLFITMEATGVYHESLAYYLYERDYAVNIELPTKVSAFAKSYNYQSKTDVADTDIIAHYSLERQLRRWCPVSQNLRQLRSLTRQHQSITETNVAIRNQLHAVTNSARPCPRIQQRYQQMIDLNRDLLAEITAEICRLEEKDERLGRTLEVMRSVPGVGTLTAAVLAAETNCFQLFESRNQLLKYAGLDIRHKESGTSVRGQSRISKAGNSRIRRCLYMPSLQYVRAGGPIGELYDRVSARSGVKKKGLVAVQRKLLTIAYALVKSDTRYCEQTHRRRVETKVGEPELAYGDSMD